VVLAASFICLSYYAVMMEPQRLELEQIDIPTRKWPAGATATVLQLSDLHIGSLSPAYLEKILDAVHRASPDLIVLTGDYFSNQRIFEQVGTPAFNQELAAITRLITSLSAPYGVWTVRGNHDFSDDKEVGDVFLDELRRRSRPVLTNQLVKLRIRQQPLYLLGVDFSNFTHQQVAKFPVRSQGRDRFLRSGPSTKNSYSHYYPLSDSLWQNYSFTARWRMSEPYTSTLGLTVYSQYHLGYDRYYRWRWFPNERRFRFAPHGHAILEQRQAEPQAIAKNVWWFSKVAIRSEADQTVLYGKSWPEEEQEPDDWQAVAIDRSTGRFRRGTVGLYSNLSGTHEFDDLCVVTDKGDTLLDEDLQGVADGLKPKRWIDFNWNEPAVAMLAEQVTDSGFVLLLAHHPDFSRYAKVNKIDLQLSGHTHGGQVYLPLVGAPWIHAKTGRLHPAGLRRYERIFVYINRGLGTIFLPIRFLSPPEITLIKIRGTG